MRFRSQTRIDPHRPTDSSRERERGSKQAKESGRKIERASERESEREGARAHKHTHIPTHIESYKKRGAGGVNNDKVQDRVVLVDMQKLRYWSQ